MVAMEDIMQATAIGILCFSFVIVWPCLVVSYIYLQRFKYHDIMRVREPASIKKFLIIGAIIGFMVVPLLCIPYIRKSFPTETNIGFVVMLISINTFFIMTDLTFTSVFFQIKRAETLAEWRVALDPEYQPKSRILRYELKDPGLKYLVSLLIIGGAATIIFVFILYKPSKMISETTAFAALLVIEIGIIIAEGFTLTMMMRSVYVYNDKYYFNQQTKHLMVFTWTFAIPFVSFFVLISVAATYAQILLTSLVPLGIVSCCWVYVLYPVFFLTKEYDLIHGNNNNNNNENDDSNKKQNSATVVKQNSVSINKKQQLINILSNDKQFELFMTHLLSEFASENLLFVVFLIHLQMFLIEINYLNENINENNDNDNTIIKIYGDSKEEKEKEKEREKEIEKREKETYFIHKHWMLPNNVPRCYLFKPIAQQNMEIGKKNDRVFGIFEVIFKKFIQSGRAPLEINISSQTRKVITQCYNGLKQEKEKAKAANSQSLIDIDHKDIIAVWKCLRQAGLEVWTLMIYAATRFDFN